MPNPSHWDHLLHRLKRFALTTGNHLVGHRSPDQARAYRINPDAASTIFKCRALGESDHAMLCGMIDSTFCTSNESAQRRAIHNGAAPLLAHMPQLELHRAPDATQIDAHHSVVIFAGRISGLGEDILNAGIVVGRIKLAEGSDRLLHHRFNLGIIRYIAANRQCLMPFMRKFLGCSLDFLFVPIN